MARREGEREIKQKVKMTMVDDIQRKISLEYEKDNLQGPGWKQLQTSIEKLRAEFTLLGESLEVIVSLENTKLLATGRVEIPDTSKRILSKEQQFIEKFREKIKAIQCVQLETGDITPEYAKLYKSLNEHLQKHIYALISEINKQLEQKTKASKDVLEENKKMMMDLQKKDIELMNAKRKSEIANAEKNTLAARCTKLEQLNEEKNQQIQQLQKESTVVLWKREKQKLIGSIYSRERGLEKELQSTAVEADDTKYRLQRRIEDLQNKLRKEQVRNSTKSGISLQEATTLRRNLFLKERLYVVAESELKKQQSYYLGIMKGLQRDHKIAKANERDNLIKGELATSPLLESRTSKLFIERLDMVVKAMGKGTITKLRSSLPAHYLGYDNPKGPAQRPNLTRDTTEFIVKTTMEEEVNLESTEISSSLVKWRLNEDESQPTLGKLLRDIQKEHPTFVDEEGRLMVKSVAKYFPMLSEEKIMHYFSLFSMWDDNGDLNLDTSEILHNLPGMLGHLSTTEEVADAIREIDIDESGTIDFYEFLLLIKMLHEGGCKSSFFQKNDFLKVSSQVSDSNSKICAIQ